MEIQSNRARDTRIPYGEAKRPVNVAMETEPKYGLALINSSTKGLGYVHLVLSSTFFFCLGNMPIGIQRKMLKLDVKRTNRQSLEAYRGWLIHLTIYSAFKCMEYH